MPTIPRNWSQDEDDTLCRLYFTHSRKEIGKILNRTIGSIRKRCSVLGLNHKRPIATPDEIETIREWYESRKDARKGEFNLPELARLLGRTEQFICQVARRSLGLTDIRRKLTGERSKVIGQNTAAWIAKNGHPRGFLGKRQSDKCRRLAAERCRVLWLNITPLEREIMHAKRNATMLARYGSGRPPALNSSNPYSRTKSGKRADLDNRFFRSSWEANYARYLNWLIEQGEIKAWEYECKTFVFEGVTRGVLTYTPDFRVINLDDSYEWHEVKGWMDAASKAKLKRMAKFYPDETVIVIGADEYKALAKWKGLIDGWEG